MERSGAGEKSGSVYLYDKNTLEAERGSFDYLSTSFLSTLHKKAGGE